MARKDKAEAVIWMRSAQWKMGYGAVTKVIKKTCTYLMLKAPVTPSPTPVFFQNSVRTESHV
jgi:hypothetical protein